MLCYLTELLNYNPQAFFSHADGVYCNEGINRKINNPNSIIQYDISICTTMHLFRSIRMIKGGKIYTQHDLLFQDDTMISTICAYTSSSLFHLETQHT